MTAIILPRRRFVSTANIQFVGSVVVNGSGATTPQTLTLSSGLTGGIGSAAATGDFVVVLNGWGAGTDDTPTISTSGYTVLSPGTDRYVSAVSGGDANGIAGFKYFSGAPDASVQVTWSGNAAKGAVAAALVFRGVNAATQMDVTETVASSNSSILVDPSSITPITAGAKVLVLGIAAGNATNITWNMPSSINGWTTAYGTGSTHSSALGAGYYDWTSGAYDPAAWTLATGSDATTKSYMSWTLALRPA